LPPFLTTKNTLPKHRFFTLELLRFLTAVQTQNTNQEKMKVFHAQCVSLKPVFLTTVFLSASASGSSSAVVDDFG